MVPGIDRTRLALVALWVLGPTMLLEPVWLTFYFGQINLVLCAAILADLTLELRVGGRTLPRGVLLGVSAAIKLIPLVFIPYLFLTRQFRAAWTTLATFVAVTRPGSGLQPVGDLGLLHEVRHRRPAGGHRVLHQQPEPAGARSTGSPTAGSCPSRW